MGIFKKKKKNTKKKKKRKKLFKEDSLVIVVGVPPNLLLGGTTSRLVVDTITICLDVLLAAVEVDDGDALLGQLAARLARQLDISAVVVVLGEDVGGPAI